MENKFRGSFLLWSAVFHVVCLVVLGSIAFFGSKYIINNYKADCIVTESKVIDDALIEYSASHHKVINSSIKFVTNSQGDTALSYNQSPVYPASLDELKKLQSERGSIIRKIDLSKFRYSLNTDSAGNMTYKLEATLPNGTIFKSGNSN